MASGKFRHWSGAAEEEDSAVESSFVLGLNVTPRKSH